MSRLSVGIFISAALGLALAGRAAEPPPASAGQNGADYSYLGENLSVPPRIALQDFGHPVTAKLAGQAFIFEYPAFTTRLHVYFRDSRHLDWYNMTRNERRELKSANEQYYEDQYIAVEITKGVYFVNFVEQLPQDKAANNHNSQQLTSFIVDLNKMVFTDSYMDNDHGPMKWTLAQGRLERTDAKTR